MSKQQVFYKREFKVVVVSETEEALQESLVNILMEMHNGDLVGNVEEGDIKELGRSDCAAALIELGSEPETFSLGDPLFEKSEEIKADYFASGCEPSDVDEALNRLITECAPLFVEPDERCKYCGAPSFVDPSDQRPPPDYCHESDHGSEDDRLEAAKGAAFAFLMEAPQDTLSPAVKNFQEIASVLLKKHYGLALNDTELCEESVVAGCIEQGYRPYQVISEHAEEADLGRIDKMYYGVPSRAAITAEDEQAVVQQLQLA